MISRRAFLRSSSMAVTAVTVGLTPTAPRSPAGGLNVSALRSAMQGALLEPASPQYDALRRTFSFNPRMDRQPALIALCKTDEDVKRAYSFAREYRLQIAVRSGGHDVLAASTVDSGIVIDLSHLDSIETHVRVGAGVRSGALTAELQKTDRAVALGCNPLVGVAGLTLGGGLGWLLGTSGAACDNLQSARMLTPDGVFREVSATSDPDLFWAIRGGGGNFGIVTSLTYRMQTLGNVVGGWIAYPGERVADFLKMYRDVMATAPRELVVEVEVMSPSRPVIFAMVAYTGKADSANKVLAPLLNFGPPLVNDVGVKPFSQFANPGSSVAELLQVPAPDASDANTTPGIYWMGANLGALTDDAIATFADCAKNTPRSWAISLGHYMHGRICEVPANATPLIRPKNVMTYHFDTCWSDRRHAAESMSWVDTSLAAMRPHSRRSTYINYLGEPAESAVQAAYGENYRRLSALKRRYDPENILHRNRNIQPAK